MLIDFGAYIDRYLSRLIVSKDTEAAQTLWLRAQAFITGKSLPQGPIIMEGQLLRARDAKWLVPVFSSRIRLFRIVKLHPDTLEFDIFHRLESEDPDALARIRFEMDSFEILWSELSFRNLNQTLVPGFLARL
jgi:hypothetical protein